MFCSILDTFLDSFGYVLIQEIFSMSFPRQFRALAGLLLLAGSLPALHGGNPTGKEQKPSAKPASDWMFERTLTISPASAPTPALKYRLYPHAADRKDGNAVPIYLRFAHERNDARKQQLRTKPEEWNKLPLDKLPLDEVKKFLDSYKYNFKQLDLGARRKTADWNYTLDAGDPIGLLLPDAQEMRMHAPLLVLKARAEIAEHRYAEAIHTVETGISFSQQISEAPFLINALVGIAVATLISDELLELIEKPDAPNLYWALTVIPRPLIDLRRPDEIEQRILEMEFPELGELDRPRAPAEWDAVLRRTREMLDRIRKFEKEYKAPKTGTAATDPASKSPDLPEARRYLTEVIGLSADAIKAMPPAQVLLLHISHFYHEIRDEMFKATYVPYPQARRLFPQAENRMKSLPDTEAAVLPRLFLPAVMKVQGAQARIERKLATLRVIEAVRLHAAANNGQVPDTLAEVTIVPVPNDPGTGQPFAYQRDGQTFTIISRIADESTKLSGLRYRVTMRK
jgi:hypothetical protein